MNSRTQFMASLRKELSEMPAQTALAQSARRIFQTIRPLFRSQRVVVLSLAGLAVILLGAVSSVQAITCTFGGDVKSGGGGPRGSLHLWNWKLVGHWRTFDTQLAKDKELTLAKLLQTWNTNPEQSLLHQRRLNEIGREMECRWWSLGGVHLGYRAPQAVRSYYVEVPLSYICVILFAYPVATVGFRCIRARRGSCANCGYDLRGCEDQRCSECGQGFSIES